MTISNRVVTKKSSVDHRIIFLLDWYVRKKERHPSYSIRALARQLEVSHSMLSLVFRGRRRPSDRLVAKASRLIPVRAGDARRTNGEETVGRDHDWLKRNWKPLALLHILKKERPRRIDARLGAQWLRVSALEAEVVLRRLSRLGFLQQVEARYRPHFLLIDLHAQLSKHEGA